MTEQAGEGVAADAVSPQVRAFLIADVRGYTRFTLEQGDEAAADFASRFGQIAGEIVQGREGHLIELRGDEALAVFSSARQALRASIEMQDRFGEQSRASSLPFKVGIGLDAGEAIPVGDGFRGAALNLAARLCSLAGPGEVLASDTVANLARKIEGVSYSDRGSVQLKGFVEDVRVVEVSRPPSGTSLSDHSEAPGVDFDAGEKHLPIGGFLGALPAGTLISRQDELSGILSSVDAVAGGTGRLLLLAGEPGAGKTRLAQEVTLNVRNRGFLLGMGTCYEARQTVPYYPFLDVLASLYGACSAELRAVIPQKWPYLGRLLPEAGIEVPIASSAAQEEQERLFRAITGFLQAVAEERPIAILLDDLHWADASSLDLLQHLARQTRGYAVFLLGTYRDLEVGRQHPLGQALQNLGRQRLVEKIPVRRMEEEGTASLVADSFGQEQVSSEFAALVHRHTEGNPFFIQEVLRSLVERGDIYRENNHWERREIDEIEVPESVRETIGVRLSRLSDQAQEVLQAASIMGQTFAFDDLQAMGDWTEDALEAALEEAIAASLIREEGADEYGFSHALVQQTLDSELSLRRKRRLHLAAGEALARLPEKTREARAPELAWHFLQADDTQRALTYALLAGDRAEAVFAHAEAEAQYRNAAGLAEELNDLPWKARAQQNLGVVLRTMGKYDEALHVLESAVQLFQETDNREAELLGLASVGYVHSDRGSAQVGISRLQEALERYAEAPASRGLAAVYVALSWLLFTAGRAHDELETSTRGAELARAVGDDQLLVRAELRRGTALSQLTGPRSAIPILESVLPLASRSADLATQAMLVNNLSHMYFLSGDFVRSSDYRHRALLLQEKQGDAMYVAYATSMDSWALHFLGEWEKAEELAARANDLAASLGSASRVAYIKLHLAHVYLLKGALDEAEPLLGEAISIAEGSSDLQALTWSMRILAHLAVWKREYGEAIDRIEARLERCRRENTYIAENDWVLAYVLVEKGDSTRAEQLAREAIEVAGGRGDAYTRAEALRIHGMAVARQGKWDAAATEFEETTALTRSFPYPYGEARGLYEWGLMLRDQGKAAQSRQKLEEALAIFERLGARRDVGLTQKALDGLALTA